MMQRSLLLILLLSLLTISAGRSSFSNVIKPTFMNALSTRGGDDSVITVKDLASVESIIADNSDALIVMDFTASWCGPCKMIAPFYHELSSKYGSVIFLSVDVDVCPDVAANYDVSAMPTFVFLKGGEVVDRLQGANGERLEEMVKGLM
ncbi:hypothetical protein TrVE_jg12085 [Triparma verrucosa]|uniref:Thioredoxin domain-containing protein n=2 Tax=Triparma TaxID=722752 RepID=A0A9W7BGV2_9STRA|nr:hypothetical protein TrST_g12952 [Triparma strigata]GMH92794.1 hypothetical protein TrVE_jg12085 [Triparma verrucosa]